MRLRREFRRLNKIGINRETTMSKDINDFERILIEEDLHKKGIKNYGMQKGNDCVWVWYGYVNAYYIFHKGQIAQIQID